jgi:hypothetical protein
VGGQAEQIKGVGPNTFKAKIVGCGPSPGGAKAYYGLHAGSSTMVNNGLITTKPLTAHGMVNHGPVSPRLKPHPTAVTEAVSVESGLY